MMLPTTMSEPGSRRSDSSLAATTPASNDDVPEVGQLVALRDVRIDEDVGNAAFVELPCEGSDHLGEERGDRRAVERFVAEFCKQFFERCAVVLVEEEFADRNVVTPGLGLGADDPGVEVGPVFALREAGHDHGQRVLAAGGQRTGDQVGAVVHLAQHFVDACEVFLRDLAAVVDHAGQRWLPTPPAMRAISTMRTVVFSLSAMIRQRV